MGFLDDLKRQADAARARQTVDTVSLERHLMLAEGACRVCSDYLHSLAQQLNVLTPVSPLKFELDGRHTVQDLKLCEFRTDSRLGRLGNHEVFDHIGMGWKLRSGQRLTLAKDFPVEWERLEARLKLGGVDCIPDVVRHPETGKLIERRYSFVADFQASVRVVPDHAQARLQFSLRNLDPYETVTAGFAAIEVGAARLDELARWIVGEPNEFLRGAVELRRSLV